MVLGGAKLDSAGSVSTLVDTDFHSLVEIRGKNGGKTVRGRFYWCKMSHCIAEIVWRENGQPICFGKSGIGNICDEPDGNFVAIPCEPLFWHLSYWFNRLRQKRSR